MVVRYISSNLCSQINYMYVHVSVILYHLKGLRECYGCFFVLSLLRRFRALLNYIITIIVHIQYLPITSHYYVLIMKRHCL